MHKYINHWDTTSGDNSFRRRRLAQQRVGGDGFLGRGLAQQPPRLSTLGQAWPVPEARSRDGVTISGNHKQDMAIYMATFGNMYVCNGM